MAASNEVHGVAAAAIGTALNEHTLLFFLLQFGGLLVLALLFGRLAVRVGMPAIVGELLVGVLIGPTVLGHLPADLSGWLPQRDPQQLALLEATGQIGLLLLVGLTGMYMDLALVRRHGSSAALISTVGLVLPLGLGIGLGFVLPDSLVNTDRTIFALFLGVAMCVCAIPVIAKILMDMKLQHRTMGQLILTVAVIDDTVGWLLLAVVSAMATIGLSVGSITTAVLSLALIVIISAIVGRPLVRAVMRWAQRTKEPAVLICAAVVLIVLFAAGTHAARFEAVLGAFLCGILISSCRLPARSFEPLRTVVLSVFAPVFFAMAGLRMDLTRLIEPAVLLAALAVLAIAILGKFAGAYLGARLSRRNRWEALALGAGLNARGVIEIIVATVGVKLGVLNTAAYTIVVLVAIVTSLMAPPLLRVAMKRVAQTEEEQLRLEARTDRVVGPAAGRGSAAA